MHTRIVVRILVFFVASCCLLEAPAVAAAETVPLAPVVTFTGTTMHAAGITRGGTVAIQGVALTPLRDVSVQMHRIEQLLTDTDNDGAVTYDFKTPIPGRSIWAVADVTSGGYVIASPAEAMKHELPFPATAIRNTAADEFDELVHGQVVVQVLWVRPGTGAWVGTTADGGAGDSDKKNNGRTSAPLSYFRSLTAGGAVPKKVKKDDVLILIDPFEMTFSSTRVTR